MEYQQICQMIADIHSEMGEAGNKQFSDALKDAERVLNNLKKFY